MKQIEILADDECARLLTSLMITTDSERGYRRSTRNTLIGLLMLDAGLRVSEVRGLDRNDMSFAGEPAQHVFVSAKIAKNKCERRIPLTARVKQAIKGMQNYWWCLDDSNIEQPAFQSFVHGKRITVRQIQRIIEKAGRISLHKKIHPHLLRHTFATRCMRTAPTRVVQELLGHKSITSTQIYTHPNSEDCQKAIAGLNT